jgi:AraC family transcriptional regulator, exoenzyme S synthesis regulatory protein ExsA
MKTLPHYLPGENAGELSAFNYDIERIMDRSQVTVDQYVLSFVLQGQKEVYNADFTAMVDNTKLLLIAEGNYLITEKGCGSEDFNSILLFFSRAKLTSILLKKELLTQPVKNIDQSPGYFTMEQDDFIKGFIHSLSLNFDLSEGLSRDLLEIKFEEIITYLLYKHKDNLLPFLLNSLQDDRSLSFKNKIEANKYTNLRIKELAFLCNMSISTFKRYFADVYGETPGNWFRTKRLERSRQLLESGKTKPSELVDSAGYKNLSHFSAAYKAKFGKSPSQAIEC